MERNERGLPLGRGSTPLLGRTPPRWLLEKGVYDPPPDRDRFLDRSIVSFLRLLSVTRPKSAWRRAETRFNPGVMLVSVLVFVFLLSLSRSPSFTLFAAALLLSILAATHGELILRVLKVSVPAAALTSLAMLPSALWGNAGGAATIAVKVFLSVTAVKLVSETVGWGRISRAFAALRAPALFVLVLDLAFRYVALLGGLSLSMLRALKLRSVGRNADKTAALSAVAGVLFLKSRLMAEEAYAAMECRCFTGRFAAGGERPRGGSPRLRLMDAVPLAASAALALAFFLLRAPQ